MSDDPVVYTIIVYHWWSGDVEVHVKDVAMDERSKQSAIIALEKALHLLKSGEQQSLGKPS